MILFPTKRPPLFLSLIFLLMATTLPALAQNAVWRDVTPAELQSKTPQVEPGADAEAIFWEVRIDDSSADLTLKHYIRVKIYTELGREKYSKIDIPYVKGNFKIKEIEARVIKPDGSIVELAKQDIFEREIVKSGDVKIKAMSFAVPNIEPGVIVEYRYKEVHPSSWASNMRMIFQHDIPIRNITYYFKPYENTKYFTFNMNDNKFVKDKGGYFRATLENVPALKEEPNMPPEDEVRSWLLLYYTDAKDTGAMNFWANVGGAIVKVFDIKTVLKPGKNIQTSAEQIASGATTPEEKLAKIFEFCKTKVKNIDFDPNMTDDQKEAIKPNKSVENTYKTLQGRTGDVNELFASMADALGFETRIAFGGNRSEKFFNINQAHPSFIHPAAVAVKVGGEWNYYDPGSYFTEPGMLPWFEEDTAVLLLGYKDFITTKTPLSSYDKSVAKRTGRFTLREDGTLEGTVKMEYTGHLSYLYKINNYDESANKREENLKKEIKEQISTAEISDISIENANDPTKPFTYQFKVRIPNYAQKTGKRLFIQPGFFEYGNNPEFSSATRSYDIFFRYPWSENDDIEIKLPAGYQLDNAEVPGDIADDSKIGSLKVNVGYQKQDNTIKYRREFFFGGGGSVLFPKSVYTPLKSLFDSFNKSNTFPLTLKQSQ